MRCFNQAKGYIFIDQGKVNHAVDFILQQQNRDGTFRVSTTVPPPPPSVTASSFGFSFDESRCRICSMLNM